MANLNKVLIIGNLTRDPELRFTSSKTPVVQMGIATNRNWTDSDGNKQEEVTFLDCEAFGKQAEILNQYLKKGRAVYLEGRLKLDQWDDKEGNKRSKIKVVIENFQFLNDSGGIGEGRGETKTRSTYNNKKRSQHTTDEDNEDQVPF